MWHWIETLPTKGTKLEVQLWHMLCNHSTTSDGRCIHILYLKVLCSFLLDKQSSVLHKTFAKLFFFKVWILHCLRSCLLSSLLLPCNLFASLGPLLPPVHQWNNVKPYCITGMLMHKLQTKALPPLKHCCVVLLQVKIFTVPSSKSNNTTM